VTDAHATLDLLQQLGFRVAWTYPKKRTVWNLDGVAVTLDVLDFGHFVELEGPAEVLPEMARSLGLDIRGALRDSYSVMARKFLKTRNTARIAPVTSVTPPLEAPAQARSSST
jgi:adenylate cyclase class IV